MTVRLALSVTPPTRFAAAPIVVKSPITACVSPSISTTVMAAPRPRPTLIDPAPVATLAVTVFSASTPTVANPSSPTVAASFVDVA